MIVESKHLILKHGIIIDASVIDTPRNPKGKKEYVVEDRNEDEPNESVKAQEKVKPGVDPDGKWIKNAGKLRYGFKQHIAMNKIWFLE